MTEVTTEDLEKLVRQAVPKAVGVAKYGGTVYTLQPDQKEAQFCGVFANKNNVQLSFSKGSTLKDPEGILTGTGKHRRHVNFDDTIEINEKYLIMLITEASRQ